MTRQTNQPIAHTTLNSHHRLVKDFYVVNAQRGWLILDAPYQRGDVWTLDQRIALILSWMEGVPIPAVILNDRDAAGWPLEEGRDHPVYAVIDGVQRIRTAVAWFTGEFAVPASWFEAEEVQTTEDTDDGPYVRFTGLNEVGQRRMSNRMGLASREGRLPTLEEEARVYLLVNGGGTPQTQAAMANAARVAGRQ